MHVIDSIDEITLNIWKDSKASNKPIPCNRFTEDYNKTFAKRKIQSKISILMVVKESDKSNISNSIEMIHLKH